MKVPSTTPSAYIDHVKDLFMQKADPFRAEKQMAYMRHQFEYLGLGATVWLPLAKEILVQEGLYTGKQLKEFVNGCFDQSYREILYVGIEMMQRMLPQQNKAWIKVLEKCIITQSWWDTVDWLSKLVGIHFKNYPDLQYAYAYKWIESDNIWLQRTAIIHQLAYKGETDRELLFDLIKRRADSKEFFIRKACGWALRQYSKTNPKDVTSFVRATNLSPLSEKEALRLIHNAKTR